MADFTDLTTLKIEDADLKKHIVSGLPNNPSAMGYSAAQIKAKFDEANDNNSEEFQDTINSLIDAADQNDLYLKGVTDTLTTGLNKEINTDRNAAISSAISTEVSNRNTAITTAINGEVSARNTAITTAVNNAVADRNGAITTAIGGLRTELASSHQDMIDNSLDSYTESTVDPLTSSIEGNARDIASNTSSINTLTANSVADISVTYNQANGVLVIRGVNARGEGVGTAKTVDLPIENMLNNASYNSTTKKITLSFVNSSPIEVDVADLVDTYNGDGSTISVNGHTISLADTIITKINSATELTRQIDNSQANNVGTAEVSINTDGHFVFKNLKGQKGDSGVGISTVAMDGLNLIVTKTDNTQTTLTLPTETASAISIASAVSVGNTNPISSDAVANAISNKQDAWAITFQTSTTSATLEHNKSIRINGLVSNLSITNPSTIGNNFICELVLKTSSSISMSYSVVWTFSGEDCDNGIFTPKADKTYNILFFNNNLSSGTTNYQAVVRGV